MFFVIFGVVWMLILSLITYCFYGLDLPITVNGVRMESEEFVQLLGPKIFFAIFWIVGFVVLGIGIKKLLANSQTKHFGYETYGIIVDLRYNNTSINGKRMKDAVVAIITEDQTIETYSETVGFNKKGYYPGEFVKVKHYKKDINILGRAETYEIPHNCIERLQDYRPKGYDEGDIIVIDGKTYQRID